MERFLKFTYQWEYITREILHLDELVNSPSFEFTSNGRGVPPAP
jgi:hypothetical protein